MFIFYLIFGILLIGFILSQFIQVFFDKDTPNYQRYINGIIFVIVLVTTINLIITIVAYLRTRNMIGITGDPGIRGPQGKRGKSAICSNSCGQKTCYIDVVDYANKIFNEEYQKLSSNLNSTNTSIDATNTQDKKKTINNRQFLRRINKICHSNQYKDILVAKHDKKPTEKKLIEYIKKIIRQWVKLIVAFNPDDQPTLDNRLGIKFLLERNFSEKLLNTKIKNIYTNWDMSKNKAPQESPFKEIEKYDIWEWSESYKTKRNVITINSNNLELPEPDQPTLSIIKSNNYQPTFKAEVKNDIWDDTFCPHNQMGDKLDNPNNLDKCVFIDEANGLKEYKGTWKKTEYNKPKGLSLYNPNSFKSKNNQIFYPVGSVWRGKNDTKKPTDSKRTPESINMCGKGHGADRSANFNDYGPEKETILVSGDVKDPIKYDLLWNSQIGCPTCHTDNIKAWRPIPPKGYTCLGDITTTGNQKPEDINVKCVPSKCVQEKKMGSRVWNNRNVSENTYNNYKQFYQRTPAKSNKSINVSVWSAGASNSGEENVNLYGTPLDEDGGYNLFRIGKGLVTKPEDDDGNKLKSYVIKKKCLLPGEGKKPAHPLLKVPSEKDTNISNDLKYNDKHYFGKKPAMGIMTNIDNTLDSNGPQSTQHLLGPTNKPKKLYLIDDLNKRKDKNDTLDTTPDKSDTYFLKTFNEKNNDFSSCLVTTGNKKVVEKSGCNKSNPYYQWRVRYNPNLTEATNSAKMQLQTMKNYGDSKSYCLHQYYDNQGRNQYNLKECDTNQNNTWKYNTLISQELPQQN